MMRICLTSLILLTGIFFISSCQKDDIASNQDSPGDKEDNQGENAVIKDYWSGNFKHYEKDADYDLDMHFINTTKDTFDVYITLRSYNSDYKAHKGYIKGDSIFIWLSISKYVNSSEKNQYYKGKFETDNSISGKFYSSESRGVAAEWNIQKVKDEALFDYLLLTPIDTIYTPVHHVKDMAFDGTNFYLMDNDLNVLRLDSKGEFIDTISKPFSSNNLSLGWYNNKLMISDGWGVDEYHFFDPDHPNFFPNPATAEEKYEYESIVEYKGKLLYLTDEWIYEMDMSGNVLNKVHQNTDETITSRRAITTDGENLYYVEYKNDIDYWVVLDENYQEVRRGHVGGIDVKHACFDGTNIIVTDQNSTQIRTISISDFSIINYMTPAVSKLDAITWDGSNIWCEGIFNNGYNMLHKIDANGNVLESMDFPEQWLPAVTYSNEVFTIVTRENIFRYNKNDFNLLKINHEDFPSTRYPYFNNGEVWSYQSDKTVWVYDIAQDNLRTIENSEFDIYTVGDIAVDDDYLWIPDYAISSSGTYDYFKCLKKFNKASGQLIKNYRPTHFMDLFAAMFTNGTYLWYVVNPYYNADDAIIYKLKIKSEQS